MLTGLQDYLDHQRELMVCTGEVAVVKSWLGSEWSFVGIVSAFIVQLGNASLGWHCGCQRT